MSQSFSLLESGKLRINEEANKNDASKLRNTFGFCWSLSSRLSVNLPKKKDLSYFVPFWFFLQTISQPQTCMAIDLDTFTCFTVLIPKASMSTWFLTKFYKNNEFSQRLKYKLKTESFPKGFHKIFHIWTVPIMHR